MHFQNGARVAPVQSREVKKQGLCGVTKDWPVSKLHLCSCNVVHERCEGAKVLVDQLRLALHQATERISGGKAKSTQHKTRREKRMEEKRSEEEEKTKNKKGGLVLVKQARITNQSGSKDTQDTR